MRRSIGSAPRFTDNGDGTCNGRSDRIDVAEGWRLPEKKMERYLEYN